MEELVVGKAEAMEHRMAVEDSRKDSVEVQQVQMRA